jgi:RNA polymerase sigma-70 factor (ECF subfamily)
LGLKFQPHVVAPPAGDAVPEQSINVADLTGRMVEGDEMAYRMFYDEYYDRLRRYLLVVTAGNEDTASEALQAALVRVVKHMKRFERENEFWGWLTVLARSALFDLSRKRKRYWSFLERFTSHAQIHQAEEKSEADTRLLALLDQSLAALPVDERELLESKYSVGASVRDIALDLQTSEKAIESRLGRVRRKLKAALLEGLKNEEPL